MYKFIKRQSLAASLILLLASSAFGGELFQPLVTAENPWTVGASIDSLDYKLKWESGYEGEFVERGLAVQGSYKPLHDLVVGAALNLIRSVDQKQESEPKKSSSDSAYGGEFAASYWIHSGAQLSFGVGASWFLGGETYDVSYQGSDTILKIEENRVMLDLSGSYAVSRSATIWATVSPILSESSKLTASHTPATGTDDTATNGSTDLHLRSASLKLGGQLNAAELIFFGNLVLFGQNGLQVGAAKAL